MQELVKKLNSLEIGEVKINESLRKHNTYKIGGECLIMVLPKDIESLQKLIRILNEEEIKYKIFGKGSNLIVSEKVYEGVIIKLDKINHLEINDETVRVGAGYPMIKLSYRVARKGLTGLEFASGIPGTVGGAIFMNAGAYNSDMNNITTRVKLLLPDGTLKWFSNEEMEFSYRHSILQKHPEYIVCEIECKLEKSDRDEIISKMEIRKSRRIETQPLDLPSAGSVFRNPLPHSSWKLIHDAGLRGYTIGGAKISDKHCNFIVNYEGATADDIKSIIDYTKGLIAENHGIELEVEQEFFNWED